MKAYNQAVTDGCNLTTRRLMRIFDLNIIIAIRLLMPAVAAAQTEVLTGDAEFFESKVRPVLIAKCFECHVGEKAKSGLQLDSRDAILVGGESGAAAVSGKPTESLLMEVISYRGGIQMPPKVKLTDPEIAALTEWVRRGLPWPNAKAATSAPSPKSQSIVEITDEQRSFWAFQPVTRPQIPTVINETRVRSPLDRFVISELDRNNLAPAQEANKRVLLRRVTLDLIGLPPTPAEVAEFVDDQSPDALERVVDRLLASPRYGERWGRHWLDIARYADSNGLDENLAYANAFRYRDYVVKAFREDKPFDQFLVEQLAGDLLPFDGDSEQLNDRLTATGFLSLGAKMLAEDDPVKMQMDIIDEQVDTISRAVMGLTLGCARCHDHKYDPIPAEDYYSLAGIFKSTKTMDNFNVVARWQERPLATPEQLQQRDSLQQRANEQKQLVEKLKADATQLTLNDARRHVGDYLLAATRLRQLAERLKVAQPRGLDPNPQSIPGAILIEAEDYVRGNVLKDRESYGKGIGVLVNRGETPNFAEYDFDLAQSATYQFELRYAAAGSRPVKLFLNGHLVKADAAAKATGSWTPESQTWSVEAFLPLKTGRNTIRLEQPKFFPHIDKLLLAPLDRLDTPAAESPEPDGAESPSLIPSLVQQWVKTLDATKDDPMSILAGWHQFVATKQLSVGDAAAANGSNPLVGENPPASLSDLAQRYGSLFERSQSAWQKLKSSPAGKDSTKLDDPVLEAARLLLIDPKGPFAAPTDIEASFIADTRHSLAAAREELKQREQVIPKFPEVMAVSDNAPENLRVHLRGSHLTLGKEVPRRFLRIIAGDQQAHITAGSGRLDLARWLTSPSHPLTARVIVNRIWQWHFGQGLVRSPDNFGRLGERPTHPKLLDWLASEFSRHGDPASQPTVSGLQSGSNAVAPVRDQPSPRTWSFKHLHRMITASSSYRMSTNHDPAAALADPENRLLWRFNRQRMEVEVLRDSLLAVSGSLDETPGGTMLPTANRAYVTSTANVNPAIYNSNRRSIYLPVVRSALFEVFQAFDFADPSTLNGQRDQTTVAPQALFMMNSEFVLTQSRTIAERLLRQTELDDASRIRHLYELAYSRPPSEAEVARATSYLDRVLATTPQIEGSTTTIEARAWTSLCRAILAANEFVYVE